LATYAVAHPARMTITVDVEVVKQHRLGLLTEDVEVERRSTLDVPDAGVLTSVTEIKLGQVAARADHLAEQMRDLADAIDQWLLSARATDGQVALALDLITSGVLAL